jgi:RNA polymerase sigma factor (sigma-70 family)
VNSDDSQTAEDLLASVRGRVFNLALRFLGDPEAAEDACQEILLKLWTGLDGFRGESAFTTWALAVASRHLLSAKRSRLEAAGISFEAYEAELGQVPAERPTVPPLEERLLQEELKHSCSLGMLQCLGREDRLVFILHAFFRVSGETGGEICGLGAAAYRQRLSRARRRMAEFMARACGLAGAGAPCRCQDRVVHALRQGRISRDRLYFSTHAAARAEALTAAMEGLDTASAVFRAMPEFRERAGVPEVRAIISRSAPEFLA